MNNYFFVCECGQKFELNKDNYIRLQPNQKFVCKDCRQDDQIVLLELGNGNVIIENNDF